jgi:hypothetical protein
MSLNRLCRCNWIRLAALALGLTFWSVPALPQANQIPADVVVNAGGEAVLISPPPEGGDPRMYPLEFAMIGGFGGAGAKDPTAAVGYLNFVFGSAFSADWGAVDFVPNVDKMYLSGKITKICKANDGVVHLTGEIVTEVDFNSGRGAKGVVYLEEVDKNVAVPPFVIRVGGSLGRWEFILRWCQLPEFPIALTRGVFKLDLDSVPDCR